MHKCKDHVKEKRNKKQHYNLSATDKQLYGSFPANIYLFKNNNSTIQTLEKGVKYVNS